MPTFFGPVHPHTGPARPIVIYKELSMAQPVFRWARPSPAGWKWAQPGPSSATVNTIFTTRCSPGRKCGKCLKLKLLSQHFEHKLRTCKVKIPEHLEKAMLFHVDLSKLLYWSIAFLPTSPSHYTLVSIWPLNFNSSSTFRPSTECSFVSAVDEWRAHNVPNS